MTRYYSAIAVDNTLGSALSSGATSLVLNASPVGYPSTYPFVLAVDYNAASEELVLVTGASGTTLTITRGFNGTSAQSHAIGAVIRHVISAQDLTDTQTHYNTALTAGAHGVTGALATFLGTPTSANLAALVTDETGSGSAVFAVAPTLTSGLNAQTGTTYTPVIADAANIVTLNNSSAITVTLPPSVYNAGQQVNFVQLGAGQVSFAAGSGVTIYSTPGLKLRAQYSLGSAICIATNTFLLVGDLTA
jgi:hypothetical protein